MGLTTSISVDVDIDAQEVLDNLDAEDLATLGICRTGSANVPSDIQQQWTNVRSALRQGDRRALLELLTTMAFDQAGLVLPVVGLPALR